MKWNTEEKHRGEEMGEGCSQFEENDEKHKNGMEEEDGRMKG